MGSSRLRPLTVKEIESITGAVPTTIRHIGLGGVPGFVLVHTPSGYTSYALRYRKGKQLVKLTIGSTKTFTLADARKLAAKFRAEVESGKDPHAAKLAERTASNERILLDPEHLWLKYMQLAASRLRSRHEKDRLSGRAVTLFNCFVMGTIPDSLEGIFEHLKQAALTMQQGGGVGMDFSTIRPKGAVVHGVGSDASGPLSFMDCWDAMCRTVHSAGARRGAMMGCLRIDHPDIEAFIDAKRDPIRLRNFNVSVLVTDAFMEALAAGGDFQLIFEGQAYRTVPAQELWDRLMQAMLAGTKSLANCHRTAIRFKCAAFLNDYSIGTFRECSASKNANCLMRSNGWRQNTASMTLSHNFERSTNIGIHVADCKSIHRRNITSRRCNAGMHCLRQDPECSQLERDHFDPN